MQLRPYAADPNEMVTLIHGTIIPFANIVFDSADYHFANVAPDGSGSVDITNNLPRSVKLEFPNFDPVKDNYRLSYEVAGHTQTVDQAGIAPTQALDTSTADLFIQNVENSVTPGASAVTNYLKWGAIAYGGYLIIQLMRGK